MLFQPYHDRLTAGQIREYLKDYPDHAPVRLYGGDDWSDGHTLYATKPKELYMPSQDSLSRRLGPVFAEMAAQMSAQAANAQQGPKSGQQGVENPNPMPAPSKAHKPANRGYPA